MRKRLTVALACAACSPAYHEDPSRLGDLVANGALAVDATYRVGYRTGDVMLGLHNRTYANGHCEHLGDELTARLNGVAPTTIFPGEVEQPDNPFGSVQVSCPELFFDVPPGAEPLVLELADQSRASGDPNRSATMTFHNPQNDLVAWSNARVRSGQNVTATPGVAA